MNWISETLKLIEGFQFGDCRKFTLIFLNRNEVSEHNPQYTKNLSRNNLFIDCNI